MTLPEQYRIGLEDWARKKRSIKAVYVFGSFAKAEAGPASDLDIAIRLRGESQLADFIESKKIWVNELERVIDRHVHLELYDQVDAPNVWSYVQEASVLIYEAED